MYGVGVFLALKAEGSHFGRAGVIITLRTPGLLDSFPRARDVGSRLSRVEGDTDGRPAGEIDSGLARLRGHMHGIGRCAYEHGGSIVTNRLEPLGRRLAAARNRQCPEPTRPFPPGPETDERPEGKSEKNAIGGRHAGGFEYRFPATRPPLPGVFGVQPVHGISGRARGLVNPDIVFQRIAQSAAEGRMSRLVLDHLALGREGKFSKRRQRFDLRKSPVEKLAPIKGVFG